MEYEFWKQEIIKGSRVRQKRGNVRERLPIQIEETVTMRTLWAGALSCRRRKDLSPVLGWRLLKCVFNFFNTTFFIECFCDGSALWNR